MSRFLVIKVPEDDSKSEHESSKYQQWQHKTLKPYFVWRQQFIEDRCCEDDDFCRELLISSLPHIFLNSLMIAYLWLGVFVFRFLEPTFVELTLREMFVFVFVSTSTIGYGNIVPITVAGKIGCIVYCTIGIPLTLLVLANNGKFIAMAYEIFQKTYVAEKRNQASQGLPLWVSLALLLFHSIIGGVLFGFWIDDMPIVTAFYFSFVTGSTIGFGDILPTPESWFETVTIILFIATGIMIISTLSDAMSYYMKMIHSFGRDMVSMEEVEVWFGGNMLTVKELVTLVAHQFDVKPEKLQNTLRDLDDILHSAVEQSPPTSTANDVEKAEIPKFVLSLSPSSATLRQPSIRTDTQSTNLAVNTTNPLAYLTWNRSGRDLLTAPLMKRIASDSNIYNKTRIDPESEKAIKALQVIQKTVAKHNLKLSTKPSVGKQLSACGSSSTLKRNSLTAGKCSERNLSQ